MKASPKPPWPVKGGRIKPMWGALQVWTVVTVDLGQRLRPSP